jgi:hypothetical protein
MDWDQSLAIFTFQIATQLQTRTEREAKPHLESRISEAEFRILSKNQEPLSLQHFHRKRKIFITRFQCVNTCRQW